MAPRLPVAWGDDPRGLAVRAPRATSGIRERRRDESSRSTPASWGIFSAPGWLRDLGVMSWLLVGFALFVAAWSRCSALTQVIFAPVITASIIAAVASPLVAALARHRIPRALGAVS